MKLSRENIEQIGNLSRLRLNESEIDRFGDQLSRVLEYIDQLSEVDTENVQMAANITGLENVWREDKVTPSGITHLDIAKNAPEFRDGSFVVPGVFE